MKIYSKNIVEGYLQDPFGHRGTEILKEKKPTRSFHLAWENLPKGTVTLALVFLDHDAMPVCGFTWIHWAVANIDPALGELPENASKTMKLLEGVTSWNAKILPDAWKLDLEDATGYGGCAPPDQTHEYVVTVYALDTTLAVKRGFYVSELYKAMQGHVLDQASLAMLYRSK